jgi:hypothetical protein
LHEEAQRFLIRRVIQDRSYLSAATAISLASLAAIVSRQAAEVAFRIAVTNRDPFYFFFFDLPQDLSGLILSLPFLCLPNLTWHLVPL